MEEPDPRRLLARLTRGTWRDLTAVALLGALLVAGAAWAALRFIRPAAPSIITISTGPEGSSFQRAAEKYARAFQAAGVTLRLRPSKIYRALLELERDVSRHAPEARSGLLARLDAIEARASLLKLPVSFADQFYVLREHIHLVRRRLASLPTAPTQPAA
jgi:hypothetical protein